MRDWAQIRYSNLTQTIKPRLLIRTIVLRIVNSILKIIIKILLIVDAPDLAAFPDKGPLIVAANHINFLDAPVLMTELMPRPVTGFAKKEAWNKPFLAFLFNLWQGIPIDRSTADFEAFKAAKNALNEGKILAVAPEGTRSEDGILIQGKPGVALLAGKLDVPILPMAYYGQENFLSNLKRFKRTPMHVRVGKPFRIKFDEHRHDKTALQAITDSIMLEIAELIPNEYHGAYADLSIDKEKYLDYLD